MLYFMIRRGKRSVPPHLRTEVVMKTGDRALQLLKHSTEYAAHTFLGELCRHSNIFFPKTVHKLYLTSVLGLINWT